MIHDKKTTTFQYMNQHNNNTPYTDETNALKIIDKLSSKLKNGEQSTRSYIIVLNDLENIKSDYIIYNSKNGSYIVGNYYIIPGYLKKNTEFFDNIKFLNRAGFCRTSAPELKDVFQSGDDNFGIIIYKINDTKGGMVLPYKDISLEVPVEKKNRFFEEQENLLTSASLYNHAIIDSYETWGVTPDTKNIYIDSWSKLTSCPDPEQKKEILKKLKELLK